MQNEPAVSAAGRSAVLRKWVGPILLWAALGIGAFFLVLLPLGVVGGLLARTFLVRAIVYSLMCTSVTAVAIVHLAARIIPRTFPLNVLAALILLVSCAIAGTTLGLAVNVAMGVAYFRDLAEEATGAIRFNLPLTFVIGGTALVYEYYRGRLTEKEDALRTSELREARALTLAGEARLAALAARIHPHFLFNTLNSIAALIPEDPERAETVIERLSALLRSLLDTEVRPLVPLGEELRVARGYLDIEKVRLGDRLHWTVDVPAELEGQAVPPLSVQTLVENSVKFAISARRAGGRIRVVARERDGIVSVEVIDDGPGFRTESLPPGHGLDILRSRLTTLFGESGRLEVQRSAGETIVRFELPRHPLSTET